MFSTLVIIDNDYIDYSIDLIDAAQKLAGEEELYVYGLGINLSNQLIKGFDELICIDDQQIQLKDCRVLTDIIEEIQNKYFFNSILILATDFGRMLAPRLAMRLKTGLVADITDIQVNGNDRMLVRPAFSGNVLASIVCDSSPIMMSVRPNIFHFEVINKKPKIQNYALEELKPSTIEILSMVEEEIQGDIRDAEVLISAGDGYKDSVSTLVSLSQLLNASISVSKPVVEKNKAPRSIQVGQSGKTVSPKLYIALGIYGSMQHIEGLNNVNNIISVNIDKRAPMNYLADIVVIGDAVQFVKDLNIKLTEQ